MYADSAVADKQLPPVCSMCKSAVFAPAFERQLDATQQAAVLQVAVSTPAAGAAEAEHVTSCPFCSYFVVSTERPNFSWCKMPGCGKISCAICMQECVAPDDAGAGGGAAEEGVLDQSVQLGMAQHFACAESRSLLEAFDAAIDKGTTMQCPTCQHAGMKDGACTHMHCGKCQTAWCYVCGLDVNSDECDKAEDVALGAFYCHNFDWGSNDKRCPMYLDHICKVDTTWPNRAIEALEHFHRQRTLRMLHSVVDDMGIERYRALAAQHPGRCGAGCGYSEEEILSSDPTAPVYVRDPTFVHHDWWTDQPEFEQPQQTPLHVAVIVGDVAIVTAVLARDNIDVNAQLEGGISALHIAAGGNSLELLNVLLANDAIRVDNEDWNGVTPLAHVLDRRDDIDLTVEMIRAFVESGKLDPEDGEVPLQLAVQRNRVDLITRLIAEDWVNVNVATPRYERVPLNEAAASGHVEALRALLASDKIRLNYHETGGDTGEVRRRGDGVVSMGPLDLAARKGHVGAVRELLAHCGRKGLDPERTLRVTDALWLAVRPEEAHGWWPAPQRVDPSMSNQARTTMDLLEVPGVRVDVARRCYANIGTVAGNDTSLHRAVQLGDATVLSAMLKLEGVDVNVANTAGLTPLHYAAREGNEESVALLLAAGGIDAAAEDQSGATALDLAAAAGHTGVVELLPAARRRTR